MKRLTVWLCALLAACSAHPAPIESPAPRDVAPAALHILPDPEKTPGSILPVTAIEICAPGYARHARHVPAATRAAVYASYRVPPDSTGEYEIDHLVALELGGSNAVENLWPEPRSTTRWNAQAKDALERRLHALVCAGTLDLHTAQTAIATDWIAAYEQYLVDADPARPHR